MSDTEPAAELSMRLSVRRRLAAVLLAAAGAIASPAVAQTEVPTTDRVRELVRRLDAPARAERVDAERTLLELGPAVLPALDEAARGGSLRPGVAEAVRRIVARLERRRAEDSIAASRVTIDRTGPLAEVLSAVTDQTGNRFAPTPGQATLNVTAKATDEPFWPALDRISLDLGLEPGGVDPDGRLTLRPQTEDRRVAYDGPFRLAAGTVDRRPIAGTGGLLLRVPLSVASEPRLRPLFLSYAMADFSLAAGDATFAPFSPDARLELPLGERGGTADLRLDFAGPANPPAGPLRLTGKLTATVAAGSERFAFPLGGGGPPERRSGGVTVRLREAKVDRTAAEVEIAVVYDRGGPAFESHRTWVFHNAASLVGPDDERLDREPGFTTVAQADGGVAVRYRFAGLPADAAGWRFVYEAPTLIADVPVEVSIDGIELVQGAEDER